MKRIIWLLVLMVAVSCEDLSDENMENLGSQEDIIGTWIGAGYEGELSVMERSDALDPDKYGFVIKSDGTFKERKNAGWCGTPPITYDNFEGEWVAVSDSLLEITVGFWGGTMKYFMYIVSLDEDYLKIRYEYGDD